MKTWKYIVKITRVTDGDTYVIENFDLGMGIYLAKVNVRLFGCDTWESRTKNLEEKKKGLEAKELVKSLIEGKEVELESMELDKYGRVLAKIKCEKGDLTEFLIKEKMAYVYYGDTKDKYK